MAGNLEVVFLVKKTGVTVTRNFTSQYLCRKFVNKLRYSKALRLISCPLLD